MTTGSPSTIGPYTITRELGRGGIWMVYLATDTLLDRQGGIEVWPARLASDPASWVARPWGTPSARTTRSRRRWTRRQVSLAPGLAELEMQTTHDTTTEPERPMGERGAYVADHVGRIP